MFILGIFALAQIAFLPGIIFLQAFRIKGSIVQKIGVVFASSLILNYGLVLLFVVLHIYVPITMIIVFLIEVVTAALLFSREIKTPLNQIAMRMWNRFSQTIRAFIPETTSNEEGLTAFITSSITVLTVILAASSIYWVSTLFFRNLGTVFNAWDAVVSWNQWAVEWAGNQIPMRTWRYPQLIPINWSLTYVFIGTPAVQFFAKSIMPLFPLFILILIFDLGLDGKTTGFFIGVVLTRYMLKKFLYQEMTNGYVDVAVSFFAVLTIYMLLKGHASTDESYRDQSLMLGGLFAAGAGITKQAGLYVLGAFPILAFLFLIKPFYQKVPLKIWKRFLVALAIAFLIAAPWYGFKQITIHLGIDIPETAILQSATRAAHHGALFWPQVWNALVSLGKYFWLLILLIPMVFFIPPVYRWIVLLIVFPFTGLWAAFASYDYRNLAITFPLLGLCAGIGIQVLIEKVLLVVKRTRMGAWKTVILPIAGLFLVLALGVMISESELSTRQVNLQKEIFSPSKNEKIYDLIEREGEDIKIITNYPIRFLPGLEDNQINFWFTDYPFFLTLIENPENNYILVPSYADDRIMGYIEQNIEGGKMELLFKDDSWISYQMIHILR